MATARRWLIAGLVAAAPAGASAQVSSSAVLRGEVRDSAGAAVAGAAVVLEDTAGGVVAGTETDEAGRYVMVGLPPGGPYTLAVAYPGFARATRVGLRLGAGESHHVDVVLSSRPIRLPSLEAVAAADPLFSATRMGAATVIPERTIVTAPSVDRDFTALAALSPMAAIQEDAISVAGQNSRFNALRVDGALAQDVFGLSPSGVPGGQANAKPLPLDAIRQYAVVVAPYDVRQSGFTGGLFNATTRSGGARWAASGFAFYRDALFNGVVEDDDAIRSDDTGTIESFRTAIAGFTLGGPFSGALEGARLFVAGELERRERPLPGFHVGQVEPQRVGLVPDSVARMIDVLRESYDFDAGRADAYTLENPLGNLFARLDVPLAGDHDLAVHYNRISAAEDAPAAHLGFGAYELSSAGTRVESGTHALMTRLSSRFGQRTANELLVSVQRTSDATRPARDLPQVEVDIAARMDSVLLRRRVQAGGDPLAHASELDQTVASVSNNLSHAVADHLVTVGVEGRWFGIRRVHLPASRGIWRFDSLPALEANDPSSYERLVLAPGADAAVDFSLLQLAGYAQDEWSIADRVTLTIGLRVAVPMALSRPGHNRTAELETGVVTDRVPSGRPQISPRLGFNWTPPMRRRTQVRGGIGIFTGLPPLAWIADVYANTGLRTSFLRCEGAAAPAFDPEDPPSACADGSGPAERDLVVFDPGFRYPQDVRGSLAVDHELPWDIIATVEAVYTRALHQVSLEDMNLGEPLLPPFPSGSPRDTGRRPLYGVPVLIPGRFGPLVPAPRWEGYGRVIRIGNRSRNAALAVAAELQRGASDRLDLRLAYTFTRAVDTRSLLYPDAVLNYGLSPTRRDPAVPEVRPAAFDRPHRVIGSAVARLASWGGGLDASVIYVGQSGLPYSYVYETDMNGDGYPGPGAAAEAYNDLLYVPRDASEVDGGFVSAAMLLQLAGQEPCLTASAGGISARGACRAPWSNRLDLRLAQGIETRVARIRITADVVNVLNLLQDDWGLVHVVPPVVPVFRVDRREACPGIGCGIGNPLIGQYTGPRMRDPETNGLLATRPWVESLPDSRWRAQLGVRVEL